MAFFGYLYDKIILNAFATIIGTCGLPVSLTFCFSKTEKSSKCAVMIVLRSALLWTIMMVYSAFYAAFFPSSDLGYLITPIITGATGLFIFRDEPFVDRLVRASMLVSVQAYSTPLIYPITRWEMNAQLFGGAYLFTNTIQGLIFAAIVVMMKKNAVGAFDSMSVYFLVLVESISVIGYVMNGLAVAFSGSDIISQSFGFGFFTGGGLLVIQVLAYVMFLRLVNVYNDKRVLLAEEQRSKSELKLLKNYEISYNAMRTVRHDIRNQYGYVCALIEKGEYDRAEKYLKSIGETVDATSAKTYCGNNIVNIALNMAQERAVRNDITLETKVAVPDSLEIDDVILGSVLTNLLNNAVDCLKTMPKEKRTLCALISLEDKYLLIRTVNPVDESKIYVKDGKLLTSKKDKELHGIGTKIITRLAESAGGCFAFKVENGFFTADVMMKNGGDDKV